jgi:hypothetical protein
MHPLLALPPKTQVQLLVKVVVVVTQGGLGQTTDVTLVEPAVVGVAMIERVKNLNKKLLILLV